MRVGKFNQKMPPETIETTAVRAQDGTGTTMPPTFPMGAIADWRWRNGDRHFRRTRGGRDGTRQPSARRFPSSQELDFLPRSIIPGCRLSVEEAQNFSNAAPPDQAVPGWDNLGPNQAVKDRSHSDQTPLRLKSGFSFPQTLGSAMIGADSADICGIFA